MCLGLDWSADRMVRGLCVLDSITSTGLVSGWNGEGFVSLGQCHQCVLDSVTSTGLVSQ